MKCFIIIGETFDYEQHITWIHSVCLEQKNAEKNLKDLHKFIKKLPNGGHRNDEWEYEYKRKWLNECGKLLKNKDKYSFFYQFGVSYKIIKRRLIS